MKTIIIYKSTHKENTRRIGETMAKVIGAEMKEPEGIGEMDALSGYDLIGFGSGIYGGKPDKSLIEFAGKLPAMAGKKAFIFSTSGSGDNKSHKTLKEILMAKGFVIAGEFACKGYSDWGPFKLFGGMNKGKPDELDFKNAEKFAQGLVA